jgi:hypothetical protein
VSHWITHSKYRTYSLLFTDTLLQLYSSQPPVQSYFQLPTLNWLGPRLAAILHEPPSLLFTGWLSTEPHCRAEQSRAVAYCRQQASTVTPGIEPWWDPWPYICSMSKLLFFSPLFHCSSFNKKGGVGLFGVPLLHLIQTTLHCLGSSLYSLEAYPTETTASNNPIVVTGSCLAICWLSFPQERVYWLLPSNACSFLWSLHSNGTTCYNMILLVP